MFDANASWDAFEPLKTLLLELAQERSLEALLPLVVGRLVERSDVALARIWLLAPGDLCASCVNRSACADRTECLHLAASAARPRGNEPVVHRDLNGAFRRIPVGAFKVGQVAKTGGAVVVADPALDPKIKRPDWVRAEGIEGFAGQPLMTRGRLLGVLGVFLRVRITPAALDVLRILANHVGGAIATARAFDQVESMQRKLQLENSALREAVKISSEAIEGLVAESAVMKQLLRDISAVAPTDTTALVLGESGTGKELIARAIHRESERRKEPFVAVNCAAIPKDLYESEFFGHVKGAFSGAVRDRVGRFEAADGGTLFLDEIGEMPLELQGKLLRVVQEGTYERVGEGRTRTADVRIIAATNRDLLQEVERGRFREDLYYRLNVFALLVPPLRERALDLPGLVAHLLRDIGLRTHRPVALLTAEHLAALASYDWPGNVRELRNVLESAHIRSRQGEFSVLLPHAQGARASTRPSAPPESTVRPSASPESVSAAHSSDAIETVPVGEAFLSDHEMRRRERENLLHALERTGGRIYGPEGAAAALGIKPTTLASRLKKLNLGPAQKTGAAK